MSRIAVFKTYKNLLNGEFARSESGRYLKIVNHQGGFLADVCHSSKKDAKSAVVAARGALHGWSSKTSYNRAQIIYRAAEMLESRRAAFIDELIFTGLTPEDAQSELNTAIDLLVYFAGWADKFVQVFSSVNPVASRHFNFSVPEPTGVVACICGNEKPLSGMLSAILPALTGGNTVIAVPSEKNPMPALSLGEIFATSDFPAGSVNILSGMRAELLSVLSTHMDVNGLGLPDDLEKPQVKSSEENASLNVKRFRVYKTGIEKNPYHIMDFQEIKTTWHPIGF